MPEDTRPTDTSPPDTKPADDFPTDSWGTMPEPEDIATSHAGEALQNEATAEALGDQIIAAIKTVYDPEIPVDIYELGLIYKIDFEPHGKVTVDMTLTAPGCPVAEYLPAQVAHTIAGVDGVGEVAVDIVWEPAWTKDLMSEEALVALDMF